MRKTRFQKHPDYKFVVGHGDAIWGNTLTGIESLDQEGLKPYKKSNFFNPIQNILYKFKS